jgi:hypothetical protein
MLNCRLGTRSSTGRRGEGYYVPLPLQAVKTRPAPSRISPESVDLFQFIRIGGHSIAFAKINHDLTWFYN